jgi:hypothetical protein
MIYAWHHSLSHQKKFMNLFSYFVFHNYLMHGNVISFIAFKPTNKCGEYLESSQE